MTGFGTALVLLPQSEDEEENAFTTWLQAAGWNAELMELHPPSNHENFGYRVCAVEACDRVAWGQANQEMCPGCARAWVRSGRSERELFLRQPPRRVRWHHVTTPCAVERNGRRCERPVRYSGRFCEVHAKAVKAAAADLDAVLESLEPLDGWGVCRVASCRRSVGSPKSGLCNTHHGRWLHLRKHHSPVLFETWCRTERPVGDTRCVFLTGVAPLVARQILFGIYNRSRRGSHTRLEKLQQVVDFLRQFEPTDLKLLDSIEVPPKWPKACRALLNGIMLTSRYCDRTPEQFKDADLWPGYVFGRGSKLDFRGVSQAWLRDITRAWCWDNLNRFNDFGSFIKTVNEIEYLSEYLRTSAPAGGEDTSMLDRSVLCGFANYLAGLVREGSHRSRSKRPGPGERWTRNMQYTCLLAVHRILKYGRETDRMTAFAGSFMITDDMLVAQKPSVDRDGPGDALPITVLRQLFSVDYLRRLRSMNEDLPRLLRIAAETGRRPGEVLSLCFTCLDLDSSGGPYLLYTESKVTGGQQRRLPVLDIVAATVHEQQAQVRQRFPDTPSSELRLFPRPTMNPRGVHPFSSATFGKNLRTWIDGLPCLDSERFAEDGAAVPFDRAGVTAYSFRHTYAYAQRHADAGTPPDVLRDLMGHEKIETTMGYYRIPQKRRREAAEIVGNLIVDGETLVIGHMGAAHRLADQRSTIAVPFGKCSNPHNVAAEGYGCPIRHRCFGCASFASDPSYLPEMRRRLLDLKAARARADAFEGAADWAKRDARPSDDEIKALQSHIRAEEQKLAHASPEQRALIDNASAVLRKARAVGEVAITLRRLNGEDALQKHRDDRRHTVEVVGQALDD